MKNLRPLNDHVIVEAVAGKEEATRAGIILPDTVDKEKPEQGKIVATGPGKLLENGSFLHRSPVDTLSLQKVRWSQT